VVISLKMTADGFKDLNDKVVSLENNKLDKTVFDAEKIPFSASSTGNDSYVITSDDILTYQNGRTFKVQADVANT